MEVQKLDLSLSNIFEKFALVQVFAFSNMHPNAHFHV